MYLYFCTCMCTFAYIYAHTYVYICLYLLCLYLYVCNMALTSDRYSFASSPGSLNCIWPVVGSSLTHSLCLVTGCITQLHEIRVKILVPTSHVVTLWPWIMDFRDLNRVAMVMCSSQSSLHTLLILDHIPAAGGPALCMH